MREPPDTYIQLARKFQAIASGGPVTDVAAFNMLMAIHEELQLQTQLLAGIAGVDLSVMYQRTYPQYDWEGGGLFTEDTQPDPQGSNE